MCPTKLSKSDCLMLSQADDEKSLTKKLIHQVVVADDESREVSIRQRVRIIENVLFDEYCSELLAYQQEIGAIGDTHESNRHYGH